jgi:serine/threonine protein kinase/tetratricopeptide (TPR) repeat protein
MSRSPEQRAKHVFLDVAEAAAGERAALVRAACAGDAELERRVFALLAAHDRAGNVLPPSPTFAAPHELAPDHRIGNYRLVREIAEGGFGTVWVAEQERPIRRRVALKVIKPGMDSRDVIARFEAERQALARMDHPNIAKVFDAGTTPHGRPFIVMEFVDGVPLTEHCRRRALGVRQRLQLFLAVCNAVQHAHNKGVIHRDLKPNNVLVAEVDGRAAPVVIDFGIAKAMAADADEAQRTLVGQRIGTPAYMSPEQARGSLDVDTRSDVYSLGVLLYELLTGTTPFAGERSADTPIEEVLRRIHEVDPVRPSARFARDTTTDAAVAARQVRGELDWIVMRCLEKDRERRYGSVAVLADEIERHLHGEPVLAGPPSRYYRASKFVRRHRVALTAAGLVAISLVVGIAAAMVQAHRAQQQTAVAEAERARAETELARFQAIAAFFEHLMASLDPAIARGEDTTLLVRLLETAAKNVEQLMAGPPVVEAALRRSIGGAYFSLGQYEKALPQFTRALEIREQVLGPDHAETLESLHDQGGALLGVERMAEAVTFLRRSYEGRRTLLGDDSPDTLTSLSTYAVAVWKSGHLGEAESLLRHLVATCRAKDGADSPRSIRALNNLASVLQDREQFAEATTCFEQALAMQVRVHGPRHPDTLKALNNLATIYQDQQQLEKAVPLLQRALDAKRQVLPAGHPSLLVGINNLANAWGKTGNLEQAVGLYDEAIVMADQHLGQGHRYPLGFLLAKGRLLVELQRPDAAVQALDELDRRAQQVEAPPTDLLLAAESERINAYLALHRPDDAARHSADLADRAAAHMPADRPELAVFRIQHGLVLAALGRTGQALPLLTEGHARLPASHRSWRRRTAAAIVEALEQLGRGDEAGPWRTVD